MDTALNMTAITSGPGVMQTGTTPSHGKLSADLQKQLNDRRLREQCSEFESLLYATMLQSMRKTVDKTELFYGGRAEEIFTSMLDDEYAKIMSNSSQKGIAEALYQQFTRQELSRTIEKEKATEGTNSNRKGI